MNYGNCRCKIMVTVFGIGDFSRSNEGKGKPYHQFNNGLNPAGTRRASN
jgi:hypothetical protein